MQIADCTKYLLFNVGIDGVKRKLLLSLLATRSSAKRTEHCKFGGVTFVLKPKNPNEKLIQYFYYNLLRFYESSEFCGYMESRLKPGLTFVDIGANLGLFALLAKRLGAKTIGFEPEPNHIDFLQRNPFLYDEFYPIALSDSKKTSTFFVGDEYHLGASSLVGVDNSETSPYQESIDVETDRLDNILTKASVVESIAIIKIDVEGHEESTVKGMTALLNNSFRGDIWCEVRNEKSNRNPGSDQRVIAILKGFGFNAYTVKRKRKRPFRSSDAARVYDLLFTKS